MSDAAPTHYEVPVQGQQHENVYELVPDPDEKPNPISEEIYETVSPPNIYCVPCTADQVNANNVFTCIHMFY